MIDTLEHGLVAVVVVGKEVDKGHVKNPKHKKSKLWVISRIRLDKNAALLDIVYFYGLVSKILCQNRYHIDTVKSCNLYICLCFSSFMVFFKAHLHSCTAGYKDFEHICL